MSRYRFIAVEKAQYSVAQLCRVLQVAPSGFYAWRHRQPSHRALANVTLTEEIQTIHEWSRCTYGAPRIHAELQARKKRVSRKRVARLMRVAGLVGHLVLAGLVEHVALPGLAGRPAPSRLRSILP